MIHHGDCLEVMRRYPDNHFSNILTDPPYGLSFMNKSWDHSVPGKEFWVEALRICKPGAIMLAFGGSRTYHRLACAIEDAGWEIRDCLMWIYGSGFPKSLDITKAIDKRGGNPGLIDEIAQAIKQAREGRNLSLKECDDKYCGGTTNWSWYEGRPAGTRIPSDEVMQKISKDWPELEQFYSQVVSLNREVIGIGHAGLTGGKIANFSGEKEFEITAPESNLAKQFSGYGTALKPAYEPILLCMKPLDGTFAQNAEKWGVAGINIDACRLESKGKPWGNSTCGFHDSLCREKRDTSKHTNDNLSKGRWPANTLFDEQAAEMLDQQSGILKSGSGDKHNKTQDGGYQGGFKPLSNVREYQADSGGASRFFYCAKASPSERNGNPHPTVKPIRLLEYLLKLITPPKNALVLDPFVGSGSTIVAAQNLGIECDGIEISEEYCEIAKARSAV